MKVLLFLLVSFSALLLGGCASRFPQPDVKGVAALAGPSAVEILDRSLAAHGGDLREGVEEVSFAISGKWGALIKKIQPLVTDHRFRIDSLETFAPRRGFYEVRWKGPDGEKVVVREKGETTVSYNGVGSSDADVIASSAMTSDAFQLFHFGPSLLRAKGGVPRRLEDGSEKGRDFYRLYFEWEPGFGEAARDEVVAWFDKETNLMYRVWITLEGFRTTRGASVDVTFFEYETKEGITLPVKFVERVRAPIGIKAHEWETTDWSVTRVLAE